MNKESFKDGLKNGERGRGDPLRAAFDEDYKKGIDAGAGIRDGEKARRELEKHPIAGPLVDAFCGGFDTLGKSKDYERTYKRVKHGEHGLVGESPRKVFGDELRSYEGSTRRSVSVRGEQVLHESGDEESSAWGSDDYGEQSHYLQKEKEPKGKAQTIRRIEESSADRRFHVYKHTSREAMKRALESGRYSGVTFEPSTYLLKYKCDRCGHEFYSTHKSYGVIPEFAECRMGCSEGNEGVSLLGLVKVIASLFTEKPAFGYGRLISQEELC